MLHIKRCAWMALILALLAAGTARAEPDITFLVNTTADTPDASPGSGGCADAGGSCSLRAAIMEANAVASADTITLPAGTYNLGSLLDINSTIIINGANQTTTIINGNAAGLTGFRLSSGSLELNDVTLQHFAAALYLPGAFNGSLTIFDSRLRDNTNTSTSDSGSALRIYCSACAVALHHVSVSGNRSPACGAISSKGLTTIDQNSSLTDNHATSTTGGAVCIKGGAVSVLSSIISGNDTPDVSSGFGGAFYMTDGALSLFLSDIQNNSAQSGGAIYASGGSLGLDSVNVLANSASSAGGAILVGTDLSLAQITFSDIMGNQATYGGGIFNYHANLQIKHSALISNTVTSDGGALYVQEGLATLTNSTVSGNNANRDGAGIHVKYGGLKLANATITRNTADADDNGDGMGGGVYQYSGANPVVFRNTIIAGNEDLTVTIYEICNPDCLAGATFTSEGYNLVGKRSTIMCPFTLSAGDMVGALSPGINPGLGSLNGQDALTHFHPLLFSSPAADKGNPAGCKDFSNMIFGLDQRGEFRPIGRACDIGAIEDQILRRYTFLPLAIK